MRYDEIRERLTIHVEALEEMTNDTGLQSVGIRTAQIAASIEALKALSQLPEERVETADIIPLKFERLPLDKPRVMMYDLYEHVRDLLKDLDRFDIDEDGPEAEMRADAMRIFGLIFKYGALDK